MLWSLICTRKNPYIYIYFSKLHFRHLSLIDFVGVELLKSCIQQEQENTRLSSGSCVIQFSHYTKYQRCFIGLRSGYYGDHELIWGLWYDALSSDSWRDGHGQQRYPSKLWCLNCAQCARSVWFMLSYLCQILTRPISQQESRLFRPANVFMCYRQCVWCVPLCTHYHKYA